MYKVKQTRYFNRLCHKTHMELTHMELKSGSKKFNQKYQEGAHSNNQEHTGNVKNWRIHGLKM